MPRKPDLESAYALETPDDNRALYAGWAATYDKTFAAAMDFRMPGHVAEIFRDWGGVGPVLDVGAGTGLVAAEILRHGPVEIDALDLSAEMLAVAGEKRFYRQLIEADLTQPLPLKDETYAAITSCGTFTHGHVGPKALDELMRVARPGALFVLTIKVEHYEDKGFAAKFANLETDIRDFRLETRAIYGPGATDEHNDDQGYIAVFSKA